MLKRFFRFYSQRSRRKRAKLFLDLLKPTPEDKILNLGSGDGSRIASIIPFRENVILADISEEALKIGREKFGFKTILLREDTCELPFPDNHFDIVFCSSVIEHVTGNKRNIWNITDDRSFQNHAFRYQFIFASEIRRIAKSYFVQTPNKYFIIEPHTWLPGIIIYLPRKIQIKIIKVLNKIGWPKKTSPDWNLLTVKDMKKLFPDAEIIIEKFLGMSKSIIAVKSRSYI